MAEPDQWCSAERRVNGKDGRTTKTDPRCAYMAKPGQNEVEVEWGRFLAGTGCAYMAEPVAGIEVSK